MLFEFALVITGVFFAEVLVYAAVFVLLLVEWLMNRKGKCPCWLRRAVSFAEDYYLLAYTIFMATFIAVQLSWMAYKCIL